MCDDCKDKVNEVTSTFKPYTLEELEQAHLDGNKYIYTGDEIGWFYNLHNRVFNTYKQPGCGKCFVNIRRNLSRRYLAER